jgi:hypothetical protein
MKKDESKYLMASEEELKMQFEAFMKHQREESQKRLYQVLYKMYRDNIHLPRCFYDNFGKLLS